MAEVVLKEQDVIADIAQSIGMEPDAIPRDASLTDLGMDSIRTMSLIEKWRADGSDRPDFIALASEPVLDHWIEVLTGDRDEERDEDSEDEDEK